MLVVVEAHTEICRIPRQGTTLWQERFSSAANGGLPLTGTQEYIKSGPETKEESKRPWLYTPYFTFGVEA